MGERVGVREIAALCDVLKGATSRWELVEMIRCTLARYSLYDLQLLRGAIERELLHLPRMYRERLYPKMIEQIFGTHHAIFTSNILEIGPDGPLDTEYRKYWEMVSRVCLEETGSLHPRLTFLYYLLTAFRIFVMRIPAHPVGTPFPGGFHVRMKGGIYYCPVKEKEKEVENAICRFCPVEQDPSA